MPVRLRRAMVALLGVGGMVGGLFVVFISNRFPAPFNFPLIVVGIVGAITGGLIFGAVAVAWLMGQAVRLSEASPPSESRGKDSSQAPETMRWRGTRGSETSRWKGPRKP